MAKQARDNRARDREQVKELRARVARLRLHRSAALRAIRAQCRERLAWLRTNRKQELERIRAEIARLRAERQRLVLRLRAARGKVRELCRSKRDRVGAGFEAAEREAQKLVAEAQSLAKLMAELDGKRRQKTRRRSVEAIQESDDAVEGNLPAELVGVWRSQKSRIKGTDGRRRLQAERAKRRPVKNPRKAPPALADLLRFGVVGMPVPMDGIRQESLDWIRGGGDTLESLPVTITVYPDSKRAITDGRHRILVARERGQAQMAVRLLGVGPRGGTLWERYARIPIGPPVAQPVAPRPPPSPSSATVLDERVMVAIGKLESRPGKRVWVAHVRKALPQVARADLDASLLRLQDARQIDLVRDEMPQPPGGLERKPPCGPRDQRSQAAHNCAARAQD